MQYNVVATWRFPLVWMTYLPKNCAGHREMPLMLDSTADLMYVCDLESYIREDP
jgi:hypothetical protein